MINFKVTFSAAVLLLVSLFNHGNAYSSVITEGFTFSVADNCEGTGSHFHSSTGGDFGNPSGKAEVGSFSCEAVRGLSEYNITGLSPVSSAFVSFKVYSAGGLFSGINNFPFNGTMLIDAYIGNNLENISDFNIASFGNVSILSTLSLVVGNSYSFNITSLLNNAIAANYSSFGIRIAATSADNAGAWTFDSFKLTTDDLTTEPPSSVPLPGTLMLFITAMLFIRKTNKKFF